MGKKEKEEDKLKSVKKKVAGGATAAGLGVSVLLGGLFESPAELTQKNADAINRQEKNPVVMMIDMDEEDPDGEEDNGEENQEEEETGLFARIKKKILELPAAVRAIVGVPLWAIGWVIIHVLSLAWEAVLAPVLGIVLKWVLGGLALLAVFAAAMKCAFPHLPLKKILRPKNILFILLGTVILGIADKIIPLFWSDYPSVRFVIMLGGGLLVLFAVGIPFVIKTTREQKEEERKKLEKEENKSQTCYYIENTLLAVKEKGKELALLPETDKAAPKAGRKKIAEKTR